MPPDVAAAFASLYSGEPPAERAVLDRTILPAGASTLIHLGSGLYHGR
jgi:hypothetical protein